MSETPTAKDKAALLGQAGLKDLKIVIDSYRYACEARDNWCGNRSCRHCGSSAQIIFHAYEALEQIESQIPSQTTKPQASKGKRTEHGFGGANLYTPVFAAQEKENAEWAKEILKVQAQIPRFRAWTVIRHPLSGKDTWLRDYLLDLADRVSTETASLLARLQKAKNEGFLG